MNYCHVTLRAVITFFCCLMLSAEVNEESLNKAIIINGRPVKIDPDKSESISRLVPNSGKERVHVKFLYKRFDAKCSILLISGGEAGPDFIQFDASGGSAGEWSNRIQIEKNKSLLISSFFRSYVKFSEQAKVVSLAHQEIGSDSFLYVGCNNLWVEVIPAAVGTRNSCAVQLVNDLFKFALSDRFGDFTAGGKQVESYVKEAEIAVSKRFELSNGLDFHVWLPKELEAAGAFKNVEIPEKLSEILEKR